MVSRAVYGHVITKFSRMGRLLHFPNHGAPLARFARESSAKKVMDGFWLILKFHRGPYLKFQIHFKQLSTSTSIPSFSAKSVALVKKNEGKIID